MWWRRLLAVVAVAVAAMSVARLLRRTPASAFAHLAMAPLPGDGSVPDGFSGIRATFLGVATVLLDDGETQIMTDGFFSRPSLWQVLTGADVVSDRNAVTGALRRAGVTRLAAVVPIHSHYDHALDTALVAELTGAVVLGSQSTANIALGHGLSAERVVVAKGDGETFRFGKFEVTLVLSQHSAKPFFPGNVSEPLTPPAPASAYQMGECYSVFVHHTALNRTVLIHGSTNYVTGALQNHSADVVFLGSVGMSSMFKREAQVATFRDAYWDEVVQTVGARRVFPVHWDDFFAPSDQPMMAAYDLIDDFVASISYLRTRGQSAGVDVRFPIAYDAIDPFADLPA